MSKTDKRDAKRDGTGEGIVKKFLRDMRDSMGIQTDKMEWYLEDLSAEELDLRAREIDISLRYNLLSAADIKEAMDEKGFAWPIGLKITELVKTAPAKEIIEEEKAKSEAGDEPLSGEGASTPEEPAKHAKVAFVGASPSRLDKIRGRVYCGPVGKTLQEHYLSHLDVQPDEVWLGNIVPEYLEDDNGPRQPTAEEIAKHIVSFYDEMKRVNPVAIVALGKTAHKALGDMAAEWVPHPRAISMWGNSGEVQRKMERVAKTLDSAVQMTIAKSDAEQTFNVLKADEEKQIVYGVVMEPDNLDTDLNWTTSEEIEKAAHFYMQYGVGIDKEHSRENVDAAVVESYIAPDDFDMDGAPVAKGTWVMAVHVEDTEEWESLKSENRLQFSIDALVMIDPNSMPTA